jgi:hypothetical protein
MARLESISVAGYYPTPADQIPRIAAMLERTVLDGNNGTTAILDPCAGDAAAVKSLADALELGKVDIYTCEMEASRHAAIKPLLGWDDARYALHGDAFRVDFKKARGVGLLYLNPPYDLDRELARLEERFLRRFTRALAAGGVLVFVVPYYALAASAETIGRHYVDVRCFRFAGAAFDAFKQVVLFARRGDSSDDGDEAIETDQGLVKLVEAWASDPSIIPDLPEPGTDVERYEVPAMAWDRALSTWEMRDIDIAGLAGKFRPWHETTRARGLAPVARIIPDLPVAELMHRTYEVAMPPRPAHIAAGIAAGLFNGQRIAPDEQTSRLPPLLIKGVFDREWRTVEEKRNKDGEKTSETQVQQPKLVVTVLDLSTHRYHTVQPTVEATGALDVSRMGIADLLRHYGAALMGVMEQQCRILYDPRKDGDTVEVPPSPRSLFAAQAHAVRACVRLLRDRPGRHPFLLGEIGSGKTTVALMAARAYGARHFLALCPPHLLDSWRNEVASVMPDAEYRVLQTVSDVDALAAIPADRTVVAVLSREAAKLGHGWAGVGDYCPKCALPTPRGVDLAKKRARCEQKTMTALDDCAQMARRLAFQVRPHKPGDTAVRGVLRGCRFPAPKVAAEWSGIPADLALELHTRLAVGYVGGGRGEDVRKAIVWMHAAAPNADHLTKFVAVGYDKHDYSRFAESLPVLLGPAGAALEGARTLVGGLPSAGYSYDPSTPLSRLESRLEDLRGGEKVKLGGCDVSWSSDDGVLVDGVEVGSVEAAARALACIARLAEWGWSDVCGEPLFQAIPEPRRHPLAQYIVSRHKALFDFLLIDEGHEYATDGSAQERAAHRLTTMKLPTIIMTGSVMNGYAASLFTNMWALSTDFREEFERTDGGAFCDRYGYRKRVVQDRKDGEVVSFGSQTDRVERSERDAGNAPGVLPLFLFRHLLPSAVTIHKADLRIDLPPCTQTRAPVAPDAALLAEYKRLLNKLKRQITADRFKEGLAGKLFGALSELPSFLDRATSDVGNSDDGNYEIRYPESCGGELVASAKMLPASAVLPKEEWMLSTVESELAEGRNVMVFAWHLGLLPRLQRLIEARTGEKVAILYADKVPTAKRQAWIDREIVKKKRRVMVTNPVAIQTGLNNLVHFATEIWHENPACNPIVYRQAVGRVDRIGQKLPTRIHVGHYEDTLQANMYDLLMAKVAISTATDGLDPESALRASGIVEDEYLTGLSIGKQLWAMVSDDFAMDQQTKKRISTAA